MDSHGQYCPHGLTCQFAHGVAELRIPGGPGESSAPAPPHIIEEARAALMRQAEERIQLERFKAQEENLKQSTFEKDASYNN
jgi:hypothetical protein